MRPVTVLVLALAALAAGFAGAGCGPALPRGGEAPATPMAPPPEGVRPAVPAPPPTAARPEPTPRGLPEAILAVPNGGTDEWDDGIRPLLLQAYDRDRSGSIDTAAEVEKIPCQVWVALDRSMTAGGRYHDIRPIYGFEAGYGWVGSAIGFDESVRVPADAAMAACGLAE